ncbi:MAG TPA: MFS transporter [Burkholderiales bacterium]|nr:MFS transporter [Burkholderiales bacterium]
MISLARYSALLAPRDLRQAFAVSVLGRLPIGITGLAILILIQGTTGSFSIGGLASGCYVAGLAAVAPVLGRLIDRYGPRLTLLASAVLFPAALIGLALSVRWGAPAAVMFALAAAAGAAFPPITVCMRTYLKRRFADDALLAAAYSLESVLIELIFIVGPIFVAVFVALATPTSAVVFAALSGFAGTILFLRSPAMRGWTIEHRSQKSLLGPLVERGFAPLIAVIFAYSTAFGLMEIGITAYATERGQPALAGVLLGIMSAGSAVGGLAYGSRSWNFPLARQFAGALGLMGLGLAVLTLGWNPWAFSFWCAIAGIIMAPALIMQAMLVAKTARPEHSTEAFTWSTSALLSGVGAGLAAGGALLEISHARAALAAASVMAIGAALGAVAALRQR